MEDTKKVLEEFIETFKNEIVGYFNRCYSYIKDLLNEKNINLWRKPSLDSEKERLTILNSIIESIRLAFLTIGIPKNKLAEDTKKLRELTIKDVKDYNEYNVYFERDLKDYIDQNLLNILIEYLIDLDTIKMKNLDLFDLLPRNFILNLKAFKEEKIRSPQIKEDIKEQMLEIKKAVIPSDFSLEEDIDQKQYLQKDLTKPKVLEEDTVQKQKSKKKSKTKQISQKTHFKKEFEEESEGPIVKIASPQILKQFIKENRVKPQIVSPDANKINYEEKITNSHIENIITKDLSFSLPDHPKLFLNYIGRFAPINQEIIERFNINITNLVELKDNNNDFFNLETLFYYITILKMLNIDIPYNSEEILEVIKKFVNGKIFCSSNNAAPDPITIFYGLAILSEFELLYNDLSFIDPMEIQMYLESELKITLPEKLHLNFFTLLCLKTLEKSGGLIAAKTHLINPIITLDIFSNYKSLKEYNPILDIFEHLASIKLLDINSNINQFRAPYMKEIKKYITPKGYVNDTITDSSRVLLIMELLDLKKTEKEMCKKLLNFILSNSYFSSENTKRRFVWKLDKIAFLIELRMLFWALLACSQYKLSKI